MPGGLVSVAGDLASILASLLFCILHYIYLLQQYLAEMVHPFIENNLTELNSVFKKYKIKKAYLLGSACTEDFNDASDVDLLIEPGEESDPIVKGKNLWDLYYALKDLLGRDVDLITRDSLTNQYFISEINRTAVPIYG